MGEKSFSDSFWKVTADMRRERAEREEAWANVVLFCCEAEQLTQKIHILGFRHKDVVEALYEAAAHAAAWGRIAVERSL